MRGRVGTDIGIKLLPVMWVFLCIPRHIHCMFMKYSNGTITQCYAYHYPSLFPVLFLQSLYPFLIQRIFHSLVPTLFLLVRNKLHVYYSSANQELNFLTYGENTICRPSYVHSILTKCVPLFAPVITAVQILALRMFSHAISYLALSQKTVATRFINRPRVSDQTSDTS